MIFDGILLSFIYSTIELWVSHERYRDDEPVRGRTWRIPSAASSMCSCSRPWDHLEAAAFGEIMKISPETGEVGWLIYGLFMVYLWWIYGVFMVDLWLIYGWYTVDLSQMLHVWHIYLQNWVIYMANVGKDSIHGASGYGWYMVDLWLICGL